jgi:hypothetical protein
LAANTGRGLTTAIATAQAVYILTNVAINANTSDGIGFTNASGSANNPTLYLQNSIIQSNGGFGVVLTDAIGGQSVDSQDINNAWRNNTSGDVSNWTKGANDVTLTGDPFVNAAGGNFALNNTAGAGAAARGAGFPGVLEAGGSGFIDIGPLQHQAAAGAGQVGAPIIQ